MTRWTTIRGALVAAGLIGLASATRAQNVTLNGRAIDDQGGPLAELEVLIHRVDGRGGSRLGSTLTDSTGAFTVSTPVTTDTSAIYFAAARFEGELFIGPFVRHPFDETEPYLLVVGGEPFDPGAIGPASPLPPPSGQGPRRLLLVLLPVIGLLGVAGWAFGRVARPPLRNRLILRMATLDEQRAASPDPQLDRERDRLLERLLSG